MMQSSFRPHSVLKHHEQTLAIASHVNTFGHCRSTPARHAANPYYQERHPDAQEKLKHYIISTELSL